MRVLFATLILAGCATPPPPPPPPPAFNDLPFRHSVILQGVGCTEFYSVDERTARELRRRYARPNDINLTFSSQKACERTEAWALCTVTLKGGSAVLSYLYKKASKRQTDYHCRESGGKFTKLR